MNHCRACGSHDIAAAMSISNVPRNVQRLLSTQQVPQHGSVCNMTIYQCHACGLVQAPLCLDDHYYDDYLMTTGFSTRLQQYLDELTEIFITQYAGAVKKVLDVGCGDGAFMRPFQQRHIAVEGIEPSQRSLEAAAAQGYQVYPGYMIADTRLPGAPYDAFVSRQVLEHVDDLCGFFQGLKQNLAQGAFGLIEVPSLEKAIQDQRFYDFFPDHVNYFSLPTLRTILEINGFSVLGTGSMMDDEYNVVIVQLRHNQDFHWVQQHRAVLVDQLARLIRKKKRTGIAMWGAGAKGLSIMAAMAHTTATFDMIVDSDLNKQGRFTPINSIEILAPESLVEQDIGTVIVSAIAYENAILEKLKSIAYTGQIYLIRGHGLELYKGAS